MNAKPAHPDCSKILAILDERWVEGSSAPRPSASDPHIEDTLGEHLESCPHCRGVAEEIRRVDTSLYRGFRALDELIGPPSPERIEATLRRLNESSPEAELIRKIRRPFRLVLWGIFFIFTLIACCALAVALYKVKLLLSSW